MPSKKHITARTMRLNVCILLMLLVSGINTGYAQRGKDGKQQFLTWASGVVIDGQLDDWGDTLLYEHRSQELQYQIKNDDDHLIVAFRVQDQERQIQALSQGFSFTVNTRGKKREGSTVVFPIADRIAFRSIMSADNDERPENMREGALQAIRAIYVLRFDELLDGQISLENTYGIVAKARIDSTDALCAEIAVPLEQLGISVSTNRELAFNVKINGLIMPNGNGRTSGNIRGRYRGYGSPYGFGYPYGYGSQAPSKPREEPGVWIVAPLAQKDYKQTE